MSEEKKEKFICAFKDYPELKTAFDKRTDDLIELKKQGEDIEDKFRKSINEIDEKVKKIRDEFWGFVEKYLLDKGLIQLDENGKCPDLRADRELGIISYNDDDEIDPSSFADNVLKSLPPELKAKMVKTLMES